MTTPTNNQTPRKLWWQPFALIMALLLLVWATDPVVPMASPSRMVSALVTHGETIPPVKDRSLANPAPVPENAVPSKTAVPGNGAIQSGSDRPSVATAPGRYLPILFTQLSGFQFRVTEDVANPPADPAEANQQVREQIPESVWKLSDKDVALTGYMLPVQLKGGLATDFMLLPNQMSCCYGIKPRINEWVIVRTTGKGVKPIMDTLITAEGTFHVGAQLENGSLTGIYQLDLDQLKTPIND
jgi:hypothetical protein